MKVLIAEDNPVTRRLLETFLKKWGYDVVQAINGREAWKILNKPEAPNLVISDWIMPDMDGLELCRHIREMEKDDYVYYIMLTAKGRKKDVIEGLEAGADDFLTKPFDREELKYRVKIGERIIELESRILRLASTDSLTGVLNRRAFMERTEQEIHKSSRENSPISLIMADIDHFKGVNDRYGHQAGDMVLKGFTEQLSKYIRKYDFVGRYGGEEFVVCLRGAESSHSRSVAERMREQVEKMRNHLPDKSRKIRITASFGVSFYRKGEDESLDSFINRADEAMYRAKQEGRNRVCLEKEI